MIQRILLILLAACFSCGLLASNACALEGDWELGGAPSAFLLPERSIYGGGAEIYARYSVLDGLAISLAGAIYGAKNTDVQNTFEIYTARIGLYYSLDVLQWVPAIGLHVSSVFSNDEAYQWHRDLHGLSVDFDFQIMYRGIRHLGIGAFFGYHIVLVDEDYMTIGLAISWFSGMF